MKGAVKAGLTLALWCIAAIMTGITATGWPAPSVYLEWTRECASYADATRAVESFEYGVNFVLWTESSDGTASYRGDWRLLNADTLLYGQPGECMISSSMAFEIFGAEDVVGREIELDGSIRKIDGVYATGIANALIKSSDDYKLHKNMAVSFPNESTAKWLDLSNNYLFTMGLEKPHITRDTALLASLRDMSAVKALLPTKWSDFDGWRENADKLNTRIRDIICVSFTPILEKCLLCLVRWQLCVLGAIILSLHMALVAAKCNRFKRGRKEFST